MATKVKAITEHASTREGQITFARDRDGDVQCFVVVEFDDGTSESYQIGNAVLTDGASVLTTQERADLFAALKKLYDHARDNLPGSTP